ncbi:MFS transporter [Providencia stuartii]|uniref:MFS transporter n=1 Tax=Providencia stuartii TaxID=588 RepID=UPI00112171C9|nr:MFS transporter [Providencia stuartii]
MKWKYRFGAVMGNALESYEIAIFAAISPYLSAELNRLGYEQATEMVWGIFALRFLSRPIGGYIIGLYAEKVGKKSALILTSFITGLATLSMAFLPIELLGAYTPIAILIIQLALSFSFAGEYPSLVTYLFKDSSLNERAKISAMIVCSGLLGFAICLGMVFVLDKVLPQETMQTIGWRIPLFLGLINVIISFWFRAKLPEQPINNLKNKLSIKSVIAVIFIAIPGAVIFYMQSISSIIIISHLNLGDFKSLFMVVSTCILISLIIIIGWWTDKYSSPEKIFSVGVWGGMLLSIPLYYLLEGTNVTFVFIAQFLLLIFSSLILSATSSVLFSGSLGNVVVLALGNNIAQTCIGGLTPLTVNYLKNYGIAYIGLFISLICLVYIMYGYLTKNYHVKQSI